MVRFYGSAVAASLAVSAAPAAAVVYTNSFLLEDVTLDIRIETDGSLGLIGIDNLVSFGGSVTDQDGDTFDFLTTYLFNDPFDANRSYGPYLASPTSFNLNGNYLATTFIIKSDATYEILGIGDADQNPDIDFDSSSEFNLAWSFNGQQQSRYVQIANSEFNQNIAFAAGAGPVPEPATWAMLVFGFGVIGSTARRRVSRRVAWASSSA